MSSFLNFKHYTAMVFDHIEPDTNTSAFREEDWSSTPYGNCKEEIPSNAPKPRGLGFTMRASADSDHARDSLSRRSKTGFIVWLHSAPICWYSKNQGSCETSSFASEFMAMKQCFEYLRLNL